MSDRRPIKVLLCVSSLDGNTWMSHRPGVGAGVVKVWSPESAPMIPKDANVTVFTTSRFDTDRDEALVEWASQFTAGHEPSPRTITVEGEQVEAYGLFVGLMADYSNVPPALPYPNELRVYGHWANANGVRTMFLATGLNVSWGDGGPTVELIAPVILNSEGNNDE